MKGWEIFYSECLVGEGGSTWFYYFTSINGKIIQFETYKILFLSLLEPIFQVFLIFKMPVIRHKEINDNQSINQSIKYFLIFLVILQNIFMIYFGNKTELNSVLYTIVKITPFKK